MSINIGDSLQNKLEYICKFINNNKPAIIFLLEVHSFEEEIRNFDNFFMKLGYRLSINCEKKPLYDLYNFSKRQKVVPKGGVVSLTNSKVNIENTESVIKKSVIKINVKINNEIIEIFVFMHQVAAIQ